MEFARDSLVETENHWGLGGDWMRGWSGRVRERYGVDCRRDGRGWWSSSRGVVRFWVSLGF